MDHLSLRVVHVVLKFALKENYNDEKYKAPLIVTNNLKSFVSLLRIALEMHWFLRLIP